jgi:hypothetical protein
MAATCCNTYCDFITAQVEYDCYCISLFSYLLLRYEHVYGSHMRMYSVYVCACVPQVCTSRVGNGIVEPM